MVCASELLVLDEPVPDPAGYSRLPVGEAQQDGSVETVLQAVGLWAAGVDEGVHGCQNKTLLVKLLQLPWQLPH